jgi:hypothetical protein
VVLLGKPRDRTHSLLHLVLCGILLPLSYVALLVSLVVLAKSMLALIADGVKLSLELLQGM